VLGSAPVDPRFLYAAEEEASFGARLPYEPDAERVVLRRDGTELGALRVPPHPPVIALLGPNSVAQIDTEGVLHLRWRQIGGGTEADPPATCSVRFGNADGTVALRPGANLTGGSFDLDLRPLPGHDHCLVQVIATNGYHTSYVQPPPFALPPRPPRLLLGANEGPLLRAQGLSPQHGPLLDAALTWSVDGTPATTTGGTFDARSPGDGPHLIAVRATDPDGLTATQTLGTYDGTTGLLLPPDHPA
jgi:hypothetical protein